MRNISYSLAENELIECVCVPLCVCLCVSVCVYVCVCACVFDGCSGVEPSMDLCPTSGKTYLQTFIQRLYTPKVCIHIQPLTQSQTQTYNHRIHEMFVYD